MCNNPKTPEEKVQRSRELCKNILVSPRLNYSNLYYTLSKSENSESKIKVLTQKMTDAKKMIITERNEWKSFRYLFEVQFKKISLENNGTESSTEETIKLYCDICCTIDTFKNGWQELTEEQYDCLNEILTYLERIDHYDFILLNIKNVS